MQKSSCIDENGTRMKAVLYWNWGLEYACVVGILGRQSGPIWNVPLRNMQQERERLFFYPNQDFRCLFLKTNDSKVMQAYNT